MLIPGSLGINQNGACLIDAGAKLTVLGSVIVDCGDKHYNTEVCGIPKWLMVLWIRRTARRSIVTDHYLLVHFI